MFLVVLSMGNQNLNDQEKKIIHNEEFGFQESEVGLKVDIFFKKNSTQSSEF